MRTPALSQLRAPRVLLVRNDGLGDFVLTLPLAASLKAQLPQARIYALVDARLMPLVPHLPDLEGAIADKGVLLKRHRGRFSPAQRKKGWRELLETVRAGGFDAALLPYAEAASAALVQRAGVPWRAGSARRWYCWRFNLRNPGSGKKSEGAEFELNLDYLPLLGLEPRFVFPRLTPPAAQSETPYVVLHPYKRSGTALSWPLVFFVELAQTLREQGWPLRVVGDADDEQVLRAHFGEMPGVRLELGRPLPELLGIIARAQLFIGNSSGPLHLAGLCGVPHVGLYPQNHVSSPRRWRTFPPPQLPAANPERYLLAPSYPKTCVGCEGARCPYFNCVAGIAPAQVHQAIAAWGILPRAL